MKQDMKQDMNHTFVKALRAVFMAAMMSLTGSHALAQTQQTGVRVYGNVYGGGNAANVGKAVTVNISAGTIEHDVYGGGAKANTNVDAPNDIYSVAIKEGESVVGYYTDEGCNTAANGTAASDGTYYRKNVTTVNMTGGTVSGDVYGGGLGSLAVGTEGQDGYVAPVAANVDGAVTVNVKGGTARNVFGCNNYYGAPQQNTVAVHIDGGNITNSVYGGGNQAKYDGSPTVTMTGGQAAYVFGGGLSAEVTGSVVVNIQGGIVTHDVYGGGALAHTNTANWDPTGGTNNTGDWAEGKTSASSTTTVRLTGGTVGDVYGGGLGAGSGATGTPAYVYGDVTVDLNGSMVGTTPTPIDVNATKGCVVNRIFGCNNVNGSPKGEVTVHVYATQNAAATHIKNLAADTDEATVPKKTGRYDVAAVFGGGNDAEYWPVKAKTFVDADSYTETETNHIHTNVIIDGCDLTSIQRVFGGGNSASTPATNVTVNGTFEIDEVFGGGNGEGTGPTDMTHPAHVGFHHYTAESDKNMYGFGKAEVIIGGGKINTVYGASNQNGNVRQVAIATLDNAGDCELNVGNAYGGGKLAPIDGRAILNLGCVKVVGDVYGGAENADVNNDIELNITNGTYDNVYGGNNEGGQIFGTITVNIVETGCTPININNLFGGGRGVGAVYDVDDIPEGRTDLLYNVTDKDKPNYYRNFPKINVISATSIGNVYGGGDEAKVIGNPVINIMQSKGRKDTDGDGFINDAGGYAVADNLGTIGNIYGGGNNADIDGNVTVNIATLEQVDQTWLPKVEGAYQKLDVEGANITGSVFGGGYGANTTITGDVKVNVGGQKADDTFVGGDITIGGSVYGGSALGAVNATRGTALSHTDGTATTVTLMKGNVTRSVFGGGQGNANTTAHVYGKSTVTLYGDVVAGGLYGGCDANGEMHGDTELNLIGGTVGASSAPTANILFGGGLGQATTVDGDVTVNVGSYSTEFASYRGSPVTIWGNVYGGGALGSVNTNASNTTLVNLYKGTVNGNVFGGGLGQAAAEAQAAVPYTSVDEYNADKGTSLTADEFNALTDEQKIKTPAVAAKDAIAAAVNGNIRVDLNGYNGMNINSDDAFGTCVVTGSIFGCNNTQGSPSGDVEVHIYKTVGWTDDKGTADTDDDVSHDRTADVENTTEAYRTYELTAVYGGGNKAAYTTSGKTAKVYIETCDVSIYEVYGGGYGADVPNTRVEVKGAYEIGTVFGGGYGAGNHTDPTAADYNPGANVDGITEVILRGGTIHEAYGGSNTLGNIKGGTNVDVSDDNTSCPLKVGKVYGAGKNAGMEGDANVVLGCQPAGIIEEVYGGAESANIDGNVELTITSGHYRNVFGGNKTSGVIKGSIRLNIEESKDCGTELIIDHLYGCGNQAPYSVYGYKSDGTARTKADFDAMTDDEKEAENLPYADPEVHIISFTKIGQVFGGGLGARAIVYGNPQVFINQRPNYRTENATGESADKHVLGTIGAFAYSDGTTTVNVDGGVYGGGSLANVNGNTTVFIGSATEVEMHSMQKVTDDDGATYHYPLKYVEGANIDCNVYGGGLKADVSGNTEVIIGADKVLNGTTYTYPAITFTGTDETEVAKYKGIVITGDVFGAGQGETDNINSALVSGNGTVVMAGGSVKKSIYGGGQLSQVVGDTHVTVNGGTIGTAKADLPAGVTMGAVYGNVYGGGKGNTDNAQAGLIKGDTYITISDGTILHNIYGGGAYGSVGDFTFTTGAPSAHTGGGTTNVTITGGTIGTDGHENGMIFGSSRGDVAKPVGTPAVDPNDKLAWVYDANVIIGTSGVTTGPQINGSIYGSGENGHTYNDTDIKIYSGTIGINSSDNVTIYDLLDNTKKVYEGKAYNYPNRGNVYGGGCGTDKYDSDNDNVKDAYNSLAGVVQGTTSVTITGGTVVHNIYGAGALGSVGKTTKDANNDIVISSGGTTTIAISGGTVGVDGDGNGNVFGAARGDETTTQAGIALVKTTSVIISGDAAIKGNVYGGGQVGDVGTYHTVTDAEVEAGADPLTKGNNNYLGGDASGVCNVVITGGTIGTANNTTAGHVFGAGKGVANTYTCQKAMVKETSVTISDGTIYGDVYGGGEVGRVEHDATVTIGLETLADGSTTYYDKSTTEGVDTYTPMSVTAGTTSVAGKYIRSGVEGSYVYIPIGSNDVPTIHGNVFGAGAGLETHGYSALVRGNTTVAIQGSAAVWKNVYGGGKAATVGKYWVSHYSEQPGNPAPTGFPSGMPYATRDGGFCRVTIQGHATIGPASGDATEAGGQVFGAGKGVSPRTYSYTGTDKPSRMNEGGMEPLNSPEAYFQFLETLALASNTVVTIGGATIKGSVFGGSESGFVQDHTTVTVNSGTIGTATTETYGNVFGGGKGIASFAEAGRVRGNTTVAFNGGTAYGSVYGGGKYGDVGTINKEDPNMNYKWTDATGSNLGEDYTYNNTGMCIVTVSGGEVKKHVFGAGKGEQANSFECERAMVYRTSVIMKNGKVNGNVYGGGEIGRVENNTAVMVGLEKVADGTTTYYELTNAQTQTYSGSVPAKGTRVVGKYIQSGVAGSYVYTLIEDATSAPEIVGSVFGAGAGVDTHGYSALVRNNSSVTVQGSAKVRTSVYGGGQIATVGKYWVKGVDYGNIPHPSAEGLNLPDGMPYANRSGGECTVIVQGQATIGPETGTASETAGHVFGAGKGVEPHFSDGPQKMTMDGTLVGFSNNQLYLEFLESLALVTTTHVTIDGATVKGSVYGGSESGFVQTDTDVRILNGVIGTTGTTTYGDVYGGGKGLTTFAEAGRVKGNTTVTIVGGITNGSVYGGAALAKSNTESTTTTGANPVTTYPTSTVNLFGGVITGDAYGGGKGNASNAADVGVAKVNLNGMSLSEYNTLIASLPDDAYKTLLTSILTPLDVNGDGDTTDDGVDYYIVNTGTKGCTLDRIFGANNTNGTPKGDVTVHVYATQSEDSEKTTIAKKFFYYYDNYEDAETTNISAETDVDKLKGYLHDQIRKAGKLNISTSTYQDTYDNASDAAVVKTAIANLNADIKEKIDDPNTSETQLKALYDMMYDVRAVYGGGNEAVYNPASFYTTDNTTGSRSQVIIDGCDLTSIEMVYGGGNAAAVPESNVTVNAAYEIYNVYGGGNGKDATSYGENPGADVGTPDHGATTYGTGNANSTLKGGYIHEAYGGSNQNGIIKGSINQSSDPDGSACELMMDKVVGAGKYADIDGDVNMTLDCQPNKKVVLLFAGADEANVNGNITLNITNGRFGQVFGGNNLGGAVKGRIIVNVEETGCQPINIDELYLCGNNAAYSVYGYYQSNEVHPVTGKKILKPRESSDDEHKPVKDYDREHDSWTVYSGEEGNTFTSYGDPMLNVISCTHIGQVFGGGYGTGAIVYGNPTVNINMIQGKYANDIPSKMTALGIDATEAPNTNKLGIIGDVYGGGNAANVIGNPTVNIGTESQAIGAYIAGNVYGGGKGSSDTYACEKAMIGKDGDGIDNPDGGTTVRIYKGLVRGNVYGGGEIGRVEKNTAVTIGAENGTDVPVVMGDVFGAGKGLETHGYAALVRGNPTVTIQGKAKVLHSVYGGGQIASVARYQLVDGVPVALAEVKEGQYSGYCKVTVQNNAEIGPDGMKMYHTGSDGNILADDKPDDAGHVFAAGKGVLPIVYDYAKPTSTDPANYHTEQYKIDEHMPKRMMLYKNKKSQYWEYADSDFDPTGVEEGDLANQDVWEYFPSEDDYFDFVKTLALATQTEVTISGNAFVKGSVYGGSENGLVQFDTDVKIQGGQIGCGKDTTEPYGDGVWEDDYTPSGDLECASWDYGKDTNGDGKKDQFAPYDPYAKYLNPADKKYYYDPEFTKYAEGGANIATDGHTYYGNVFGGGSGSVPYFDTTEGISKYLNTAGTVKGNTYVEITGGHILTNVYGGCEATNVLGKATVKMTGGTLGVPRTEDQIRNHPVTCYLFGAGKGDQRIFFNKDTNVNDAEVEVDGGRVYGSVFGGGEDGHVMRHSLVTIKQSLGKTTKIGTTGNTYVDGNIFGGGRGFGGDALTAGNVGGCVEVNIEGGTMLGSIYGGGRLASVGYGLYLTTGAEAAKYGKMRADNEYDDPDNPISKTQDAQAFFAVNPFTGKAFTSTGRGKITINIKGGTIGNDVVDAQYGGNVFGGSMGRLTKLDGTPFDAADHWALLATAKSTTVNINGGTIKRSVYGGGEMGTVTEDATVTVSGGIIGIEGNGGVEFGNVYGGGKGYFDKSNLNNATYVLAGIVKGNTNVNINNGTIYHNIYGGGAYGSVGDITLGSATYVPGLSSVTMMPVSWTRKNGDTGKNTGTTTVTIKGGNIGIDGHENGMIFGSSRGDVSAPGEIHDHMAWVYDTHVVIGGDDSDPLIKGSVYGGGENGHVFVDAEVKVHSGTVGMTDDPTYPNRGNVYGAGCGTDTYTGTDSKTYFNPLAGIVLGNTTVEMDGGRVIRTIYGGGAMGSVGTYTTNDSGKPTACKEDTGLSTVNISGGKIGPETMVMPNNYGNVFGAGRGEMHDLAEYPNLEKMAYFNKTEVTISGSALVKGSVYGGSESGHVLGNTKVIVSGGQIGCGNGKDAAYTDEEWSAADPATLLPVPSWTYTENGYAYDKFAGTEAGKEDKYPDGTSTEGGRRVATDGHTFYGNVFGGGSGYEPYAAGKWLETAGRVEGQTEVEITGGHILSNVYGGNECTDVLGTCTVTMSDGTVGVPYPATGFNPALGHLFGAGKGDKRIFFNTWTNVKQATVSVSGGRVFGSVYGGGEDGHVGFEGDTGGYDGDAETTISGDAHIGTNGNSGYDGNVFGGGQGSLTALTAGVVHGNVTLNIEDGQIDGSVYGGGRLASVGTHLVPVNSPVYGELQNDDNHGNIKINLTGGTINQDVFGGSMGSTMSVSYPNEKSNADMGISRDVTVELNKSIAANTDGCVVNGSIFGCNNANGTPKGHSTVHIFRTAGSTKDPTVPVSNRTSYDVAAVYGGGKSADYVPASTDTKQSSEVIIEGCDLTSIKEVYGGGYGAATPGTNVLIKGTYIINNVFGGGFGADDPSISYVNPGANIGYLTDGTEYGAADGGKAVVQLMAGTVNHVYGGSNSKGNIRGGSNVTSVARGPGDTTPNSCTELNVQEIFGGGKNADMFGGTEIVLGCMPNDWIGAIYAGAENADVYNDVSLTLTSGKFERVFGGNKSGGRLNGGIEVNIEESGTCGTPIIIGELYGGGNEAPYSIYGYKDEKDSDGKWIPRLKADYDALTDAQKEAEGIKSGPNHDPVVNVKAFTSIGNIFGGGYGQTAKVVGNPIVNINEVKISHTDTDDAFEGNKYTGETKELKDDNGVTTNVVIYPHEDGEIGVIGNVFGGGNAAEVIGNTNVNIGTEAEVGFESLRTSEGVPTKPVVGADIRGNVYGGGNNAGVTGDTNVVIGKEKVTTP